MPSFLAFSCSKSMHSLSQTYYFLTRILHYALSSHLCVVIDCSKRYKRYCWYAHRETAFIVCSQVILWFYNLYINDDSLAKFAGLVWPQYQSGEFEAEDTFIRKTGNVYLRNYFCQAANCLKNHNSDFATFYSRKFKEVSKHQHKRAIVLTARKAVRVIFALLHDNRLYTLPKKGDLPIKN